MPQEFKREIVSRWRNQKTSWGLRVSIKRIGLAKSRKCVTCTLLRGTNGTNKCTRDAPL